MTDSGTIDIADFHWLMEMLQNIDVGLVVLDRDYRVQVWNNFMFNHSAISPSRALEADLFALCPELPEDWLRHKVDSVFLLNNRAFTIWEQRPYLFRFQNYRPITGTAEFMYQNITLLPLSNVRGEVSHVCLIVYDVTDVAVNKLALTAANSELETLSRTDRLTQLNNRGFWEECVVGEFQRYSRSQGKSTLVMLDIDHFKRLNDSYGHQAGDEVIRRVAALLRKSMRDTDVGGRYGGEEFGVMLVDTDADAARFFAERLRKAVQGMAVAWADRSLQVTISLGVAQLDPAMASHEEWIAHADRALYRSKAAGRNVTTVFERLATPA